MLVKFWQTMGTVQAARVKLHQQHLAGTAHQGRHFREVHVCQLHVNSQHWRIGQPSFDLDP